MTVFFARVFGSPAWRISRGPFFLHFLMLFTVIFPLDGRSAGRSLAYQHFYLHWLRESVQSEEKNGCNWFDQLFNWANCMRTSYVGVLRIVRRNVCVSILVTLYFVVLLLSLWTSTAFILAPLSQNQQTFIIFCFCFTHVQFRFCIF